MALKYISPEDLQIIRQTSLLDVMSANGHHPVYFKNGKWYYHCPLSTHKGADKDASFNITEEPVVRKSSGDNTLSAFYCYGCKSTGYGAIELQGALMGMPDPKGENFWKVVEVLIRNHNIRLSSVEPKDVMKWENVSPVHQLQYEVTPWTDEHLKALGCIVQHVRVPNPEDESMEDYTDSKTYSWGEGFYDPYVTDRANNFDPQVITDIFGLMPVSSFTAPVSPKHPTYSSKISATEYSPAFVLPIHDTMGNTKLKTYCPYNYKRKWGIYDLSVGSRNNFSTCVNGDRFVIEAMRDKNHVVRQQPGARTVEHTEKTVEGEIVTRTMFRRICICSGPRDAMQVYFHSDCHVVYPHSETSNISPITLYALKKIAEEVYILYDADETGRTRAKEMNMEYLWLRNVELPSDLATLTSRRTGKPCKDISEFFECYSPLVRNHMTGYRSNINDMFASLLASSDSLQFFEFEKVGKVADKEKGHWHTRTNILAPSLRRFLYYSGFCRYKDENDNVRLCFVKDNIVEFVPEDQAIARAKELMDNWLYMHKLSSPALHHTIDQNKTLNRETFNRLPFLDLNFQAWGPDFQYLFFCDSALKVTADSIEHVEYSKIPYAVHKSAILPYSFMDFVCPISIDTNDSIAIREQQHMDNLAAIPLDDPNYSSKYKLENERWHEEQILWSYSFNCSVPMNELPIYVQYLYDTCRFAWETEENNKRTGRKSPWLSAENKQLHDANMVSKLAALGYLMHRYRDSAYPYMVLAMDDDSSGRGLKSNGRSGKSLMPHVLDLVQRVVHQPGKDMNNSDNFARNFCKLDYIRDAVFDFSDLPGTFDIERMYNAAEGDIKIKILHHNETQVPRAMCPKFYLSYNKVFDISSSSTAGRLWRLWFSNYYHMASGGNEERTPMTKFHRNVFDCTPDEQQTLMSILVYCLQFYLRVKGRVESPQSDSSKGRELYRLIPDKKFIGWAEKVFANEDIYGYPIAKDDLFISFCMYKGIEVNKIKVTGADRDIFDEHVNIYCNQKHISINPAVCIIGQKAMKRATPITATFRYRSERTPDGVVALRRRESNTPCQYFYHLDKVPASSEEVLTNPAYDIAEHGFHPD